MLFIFQFHFHSLIPGKQATTRSPLQFHSPATSLNCEIHKPRVQSGGVGRDEEENEDEKLIIWWRRHGSFGTENGVRGAGGAPVFITRRRPVG